MDSLAALFQETRITLPVVFIRLSISLVLGSLIGLERERHNQPAGFRTHSLISIGATMIMLLSIYMAQAFTDAPGRLSGDPGRIAAQVVSGIGFLGAGAILRMGVSVKGVTTAASIWVIAALGLVVGAGMYGTAAISSVFILVVLTVFEMVEKRLFIERTWRSINLELKTNDFDLSGISKLLGKHSITIHSSDLSQTIGERNTKVRIIVHIPKQANMEMLFDDLRAIKGVTKINLKGDL